MGFFGKLNKGLIDTALLPVAIVEDIVTLGGDDQETNTEKQLKKLATDFEDACDSLDDD